MSRLDDFLKELNKKSKEQILVKGITRKPFRAIPFSSPRMNYMLYGGLPRGRIIEFSGLEGGGKTTTALDICGQAQELFQKEYEEAVQQLAEKPKDEKLKSIVARGPQKVVYADTEMTLDEEWARKLGVDIEDMYILQPQHKTAEQIFEIILNIFRDTECGLVVLDSVATLIPQGIYDEDMEKKAYCGIAQSLTMFCNRLVPVIASTGSTIIVINQMRDDINNPHNLYNTPGGKAFKHHCSVRLMFQKGSFIDEDGDELKRSAENPAGNLVMVNLLKTKVCKPDRRTGFYTLNYTYGIQKIPDLVDIAIKYGYIQQAGSWFRLIDMSTGEIMLDEKEEEIKIQGQTNLVAYLESNEILVDHLTTLITPHLTEMGHVK